MSILELKNVCYTYGTGTPFEKKAVNDVSFSVNKGELIGIIGHTGSGKSTLVQMLNGLMKPTSGQVLLDGVDIWDKPKEIRKIRFKVGMVFQYPEYQLFAETVKEDVAFGLKNFFPDISEEEKEKRVRNALNLAGLDYDRFAERSPFELSGGQKRRAAIAGVIVTEPEVLVLDEPVAGLDPVGKREFLTLLHDLHKKFVKTVVIVTHDMDLVSENCTRAAVFSHGKVIKTGTPREIFEDEKAVLSTGLDIPVTAYLTKRLRECGVIIESDLSVKNFTDRFAEKFAEGKV